MLEEAITTAKTAATTPTTAGEPTHRPLELKPATKPAPAKPPSKPTKTQPSKIEVSPPPPPLPAADFTKNHWQVAFNNAVTKGRLEVITNGGRVDIVTDEYVIEVDRISKYNEGILQALRYAEGTGLKAGLALYIDGDEDAFEKYADAVEACDHYRIKLWLINSHVSVQDLVNLKSTPRPEIDRSNDTVAPMYWLNSNSGERHNKSCRYFGNTVSGRYCGENEGRACSTCGG